MLNFIFDWLTIGAVFIVLVIFCNAAEFVVRFVMELILAVLARCAWLRYRPTGWKPQDGRLGCPALGMSIDAPPALRFLESNFRRLQGVHR